MALNQTYTAQYLVNHNAKINTQGLDKTTPLYFAIANGCTAIVQIFLLNHGVSIECDDILLQVAVEKLNIRLYRCLS